MKTIEGEGMLSLGKKLVWICLLVSVNLSAAEEIILKPSMRVEKENKALEVITTEKIDSYFDNIVIFAKQSEYDALPYVVAFDNEATMGAGGDIAYSRGIDASENISAYTLLAPGERFVDPDTKEELGFFADVIGNADVVRWGDVQTLMIKKALTPINSGVKLIPRIGLDLPSEIEVNFPKSVMSGRVLEVDNDIVGVGTYAVAIIGVGERDGAQRGDLLDILEAPTYVRDHETHTQILLPTETFGKVLIYKTFEKTSLAIIVEAERPVVIGDKIIGGPE